MDFIFICPKRNRIFESADFNITENRGVIRDSAGNKILDAKVKLNAPCPFCGERHVYFTSELSCPFEVPEDRSVTNKEHQ